MLPLEHSAILSTFIKLLVVIKTFVLSIFEWPFYTGFTVIVKCINSVLTLILLNLYLSYLKNTVDPNQRASDGAI